MLDQTGIGVSDLQKSKLVCSKALLPCPPIYNIDDALQVKNNFDALRFFAALGVIFSHAYPVTQGSNAKEAMMLLSGGQSTFGDIFVMVFFVISGFLIAQSFVRSGSLIDYMTNRVLRIVPGLAVMSLIVCFILGPAVTSLTSEEYWTSAVTYRFLGNSLIYTASQLLPGVFEQNIYPNTVNASIWTLSYEFSCYTLLAAFGLLLRKSWLLAAVMFTFTILSVLFTWISPRLFIEFGGFFLAGTLAFVYRRKIPIHGRWFALAIAVLVGTLVFKQGFKLAFYIFGTYAILWIAFCSYLRLHGFARYGDFSYGIYIYAFPIQQALSSITASPSINFIASTPLILLCSVLSWHWVEKPALSYKMFVANRLKKLMFW